jgi:NAD(P)-dependent dehydrogenase (short-subunit alcohol dehydrogenase family)
MQLSGKRVVLLGGTSGIGLATAKAASAEGAHVTVVSSRQTSVDRAMRELPGNADGRTVNLSEVRETEDFFASLDHFDHLVYTAGEALTLMPVDTLDIDQALAFFQLRFFSVLTAVRTAAPRLNTGGSITLTTGIAKDRPGPGWAVAASICGAVESLTKALAVELAPLRVNAVSPGVVRSPLWSAMGEQEREQMYLEIGKSLPAGRVGEVEDIAQAYLYLMTQKYSTGTVVTLDGGTVLV